MNKYLDNNGLIYLFQKIKASFVPVTRKINDKTLSQDVQLTYSDVGALPNTITSLPANGGNSATVNGHTVESNVPTNAEFTDTVYTHPLSHPSSMITGLANVATTGDYNDLINQPTVPTIPTDTNQLTKSDVYTKTEVDNIIGDVSTVLDSINGVVV